MYLWIENMKDERRAHLIAVLLMQVKVTDAVSTKMLCHTLYANHLHAAERRQIFKQELTYRG